MCDSPQSAPGAGLYIIPTPIGNLGDLSPRARGLLATMAVLACEDTRTTRRLLPAEGPGPRLISLTEHNSDERVPGLVEAARTTPVGLVSEAGTPTLSDPGARLVAAAHDAGVPVTSVPGPSAFAAAVAASGFDGSDVHFLGFLPRKEGAATRRLQNAVGTAATLVIYESPRRLGRTLEVIAAALDDPRVVVSREISKIYEEHVRGRASELAARFASARGECVIVVESPPKDTADLADVAAYMQEMQRAGARRPQAAAEAARRFGCTREEAYALWEG